MIQRGLLYAWSWRLVFSAASNNDAIIQATNGRTGIDQSGIILCLTNIACVVHHYESEFSEARSSITVLLSKTGLPFLGIVFLDFD